MPAAASVFALAASAGHAQTTVFSANFPTSWNGTGTAVTDQSGEGNIGFQSGTGATYTTATVPPGAGAGTGSMALTGTAGIKVTANGSSPASAVPIMNNANLAWDGGFTYNIDFMWNGAFSTSFGGNQKLIDYAGTESLQLMDTNSATTAALQMTFDDNSNTETTPLSYNISANTWYNVSMVFNTTGNQVDLAGGLSGIASLYVNGVLVQSAAATKGSYGDSLNRPIGIGEFGYGHTTSIIGLHGDIYSASISVAPEPSTLALSAIGGFGMLGMMWKGRRKTGS